MPDCGRREQGLVLLLVLGSILLIMLIINSVLNISLSQYKLSFRHSTRTQYYYAALGGMNLALDQMRVGNWTPGSQCTAADKCIWVDGDFPSTIKNVTIEIAASKDATYDAYPVNITVYSPD